MDFVSDGIPYGLGYANLTIYMIKTRKKEHRESEYGKKHRKLW